MSKALRISADLSLPLDWMSLATVVYGARGSGKTTLGSVIAEEITKARQRFCVIDLKGDWYGLKSSPDGKSDGIPVVVFGGDHADLPLEPDGGAFVGETVAGLGQSCILDFEQMSKGKQVHFLAPFFETLYHHNRDPLLLLLDEAQRYAPQIARGAVSPELTRCLGAVEDLVKLGRKHGIGPMLITQRGSGLNKEVSELCDMLVAFRTPGPLDQDRIKDWLDANATRAQRDDVMGKLSGLDTGTAVFASGHPELKTFGVYQVRRRETFDSSATPKVGQARKEPKVLAKPELEELRAKMSAAIERQKADDPKELRRRIAELERQVKTAKPAAAPAPAKVERVEVPMFDRDAFRELERAIASDLALAANNAKGALHVYMSKCLEKAKPGAVIGSPRPVPVPAPAPPRPPRVSQSNGAGDASICSGGLRKIMVALAQRSQGLTKSQIGVRSGVSSKGGSFSTWVSRGRSQGWIEDSGNRLVLTSDGVAALGDYQALPEGRELLDYWLDELGESGAARILRVVAEAYPESLSKERIGELANISTAGGSFSTWMSRLRGLELIEGDRGEVRLSEELT